MTLQSSIGTEQQYYIHQSSSTSQQTPQSIGVVPSPIMMLNRTPSGAQRKIRQRKEEK